MVTNEFLRQSLIQSIKWNKLVENLSIVEMINAETIKIEEMSAEDKEEIILWLINDVKVPPKILNDYIERCK